MNGKRRGAQPGDSRCVAEAGDVIFRQGDEAVDMYVIQSGIVEISRGESPARSVMARLGQGDFFGEMSLLESLPREADAVAKTRAELLVITQGGLLIRLRRDPTFAVEMLHKLSGRIRTLNLRLEGTEPT